MQVGTYLTKQSNSFLQFILIIIPTKIISYITYTSNFQKYGYITELSTHNLNVGNPE